MTPAELRAFLIDRVADGFTFPLNPTWILRDEGWYDVYEALEAAPDGKRALDAWLPPESGLRARIAAIHRAYPDGFQRLSAEPAAPPAPAPASDAFERRASVPRIFERAGEEAYERADLELARYRTLKRAKFKMRAILLWNQEQQKINPLRKLGRELLATSGAMLDGVSASLLDIGGVTGGILGETSVQVGLAGAQLVGATGELFTMGAVMGAQGARSLKQQASRGSFLIKDGTSSLVEAGLEVSKRSGTLVEGALSPAFLPVAKFSPNSKWKLAGKLSSWLGAGQPSHAKE